MTKVKLGQEVRDKVTGFQGIAISITEYLQGCKRIEVQPKVDKDGKLMDMACFDEPQLEIVGSGILAEKDIIKKSGGPHRGHNPMKA